MIGALTYLASAAELRPLYNGPSALVRAKQIERIDAHCRSFIARSPLVMIGSTHPERGADVSPRGDAPGFVQVLDEHHLAIPDRPGNNRLDTLENIIRNPSVGLLFLIPGMNETLRVNGDARITVDAGLRKRLAVDGKAPQSVIVVSVKAAYMHCAKAFMRSELWKPESWYDRATLPTLGQIIRDQLALAEAAGDIDCELDHDYRQTMW